MEHLEDIFSRVGKIYNGSAEMVIKLFQKAVYEEDEEILKGLIFPNSPVISVMGESCKESSLHFVCGFSPPNTGIAQLLIENGVNIDAQNTEGNTALHLSALLYEHVEDRHVDMIKLLLKSGANQDIRNKEGFTPNQINLFLDNLEVAEEFLKEEDKLPNVIEVERVKRCRHLIKCLLRERNDWNIPSINYSVLLHFIILEYDEETFEYLANNTKFDVNAFFGLFGIENDTLLHVALEKGSTRMVRTLINVGADVNAQNLYQETPLIIAIKKNKTRIFHYLLKCGASVNKIQEAEPETNSPLHYAVCMQNLEMVEKLVKLGADVNALTYQRSPLLLACGSLGSRKWLRELKLITAFHEKNGIHFSKVHYDFHFSLEIVEFLLDHGADIEAKNPSNRTALDIACKSGRLDMVKLLLSRGAKMNQGDVSSLHHAVKGGNLAVVKLLLEQGSNINYRCAPEKILFNDRDLYVRPPPRTPLECAVVCDLQDSDCKDIIELMIKYGANVNGADPVRRETLLHLACLPINGRHLRRVELPVRSAKINLLLRNNANINALDSKGLTPLHYALRNYTVQYNRNLDSNFSDPFKQQLITLIAFIARMIENKEYVIEENLILLEDKFALLIYQECVKELNLMRKNICEGRNFSFFDILSKHIQYLGGALKNEDFFQRLNNFDYKKNFPIYAEYLADRISEATIRQQLVDLAIVPFQKYVNKNMLPELILTIFNFLTLDDLKDFANACFVDF